MNKYCVYAHKRLDNGKIFYIGHGTIARSKDSGLKKTKRWQDINSVAGGHIVEILFDNLSKTEAIVKEQEILLAPELDWELVNVFLTTAKTKELDIEFLCKIVKYDESSPSGLSWVVDRGNKNKANAIAGCKTNGYYRVEIDGQSYSNHRIIYSLFNGLCETGMTINHIDNNSLNNNILNLEKVTQSENNRRKAITKNPSTGVYWTTRVRNGKVETMATAQYNTNDGVQKSKSFSASKGLLVAWYNACLFRSSMVDKYY